MAIVIGFCGVLFTALCVWLAVRITNLRERWAIRTAVVLAVYLALVGAAFCIDRFIFQGPRVPWIRPEGFLSF
jgi:hypothetical protein